MRVELPDENFRVVRKDMIAPRYTNIHHGVMVQGIDMLVC